MVALPVRGCGIWEHGHHTVHRVTKLIASGSVLERRAAEGNGPVRESNQSLLEHPSSAESGKFGVNLRGPPRKAKYL